MRKILLIEDDTNLAKLYQTEMELLGAEIRLAGDGKKGLNLAKVEKPDLIVMDVILPEKIGLSVLKELKANEETKRIPVIIISIVSILFIAGSLLLIVSNAVKLNLYARRGLVENMKYCGAGESLIIIPFLLEGLILGAIGSLFGIATTAGAFFFLKLLIPNNTFGGQWQMSLLLLLFTSVIGSWASFRTVRRFIHG